MKCDTGHHSEGSASCTCGVDTVGTLQCAPDTCDASSVPINGQIGDCTSTLAHATTCAVTCDAGFHLTGTRSCHLGHLDDDVACIGSAESRIVALETALATLQAEFAGIDAVCLTGGNGRMLASNAPCGRQGDVMLLVIGIAGGVIVACGVGIGGVIVMKNKTKKEVAATSVAPMPVSYNAQPAKNPSAIRNWA